ncbi:glutamate-5-semialdehyde dehydrogenase [Sandarakinorhabdus cyanobacteriorum]|uniref:Gamma-glutamyl phosphate reductase n=1 Tax=Sandarakinorhabdus cyanobacteriorum TaxID=1981098 RepID=A0A255YAD0_9SPHN|nr:glutamate-5-semialdehyde dehydrogenase [Sandarakinorhabdus cyanobacteriorum]OYQ26168.1 glutamate-5-semialdehyde dehydrogenase [Sandarakinorhabdus cyanobacteriorum]
MSLIHDMARAGRAALPALAAATTAQKAEAIRVAAAAIRARSAELLAANAADVAAGQAAGLSAALVDRLALDGARVEGIAAGLDTVAGLTDPVGEVIARWSRPNGLQFERVRVPLGVIGIIYESRPGVTADAAALCLMAGNACLLRGGSEAARSNAVLLDCMAQGLGAAGLPAAAVQMVPAGDRALVGDMLGAHGLIDVIIPRGGKGLVARVQAEAKVPVLAHLDGINHVYVDASADPDQAVAIVVNSKLRRTAVCGAMETLLIDAAAPVALKRRLVAALLDDDCEVRGSAAVQALDARVVAARPEDWDTEYLDAIASVAEVAGVEGAIAHIAAHGSQHTESVVAQDEAVAEHFLARVDAAIVLHNASTQFADGGEFGFGAEIGIATGRLHARGPVALEGLTIFKTIVRGTGQVRP